MKTMAQIAKEAGLSRFTVSKIINGDASVRPRNKEKVLALFEKYGFVPNSNAVNLVSGSSHLIGMIVPYITDGFYADLIELTEKYAAECGMQLTCQSSYNDAQKESAIIRSFMGAKIAALLIVPVVLNQDRRIHRIATANFPVIYLDRVISPDCCAVLNDNRESTRLMTEHLLKKRKSVAYLDSFYGESNPTALARRQGYLDAVNSAGAESCFIPSAGVEEQQDNEHFGYQRMDRYLKEHGRPPQAVCCVTDAVALGVMRALRDNGFTPGIDTLVGGHDNLHFGEFTTPTLTSMAQPKAEMAKAAVDMALARIKDETLLPEQRIFHSRLILRDSSSPDSGSAKKTKRVRF